MATRSNPPSAGEPSPILRRATTADAVQLAALAATTFEETFGAQNAPEDIAAYLAANFTPEQMSTELADPSNRFFVAELDRELAGYAKLHQGELDPSVRRKQPIELARIYVHVRWLGHGVGRSLMQSCLDEAAALGADAIWLGVWKRNERAIAFYRKWGFVNVGEHDFMLGSDRQTDWIMVRNL